MTQEPLVFRPTKKTRVVACLINFTALLLFGGALWYISSRLTNLCLGMFILAYILMTTAILGEWLQLIRKQIQIDETTISAHAGKKSFKFNWDELVSINLVTTDERSKKQELIVFIQNDEAQFDLTGFDKTAVWQAIETYAPAEILEPNAYQKQDQYQLYKQKANERLQSMTLPVSVTVSYWAHSLYIVGLLFSSFCAYGSFTSNTVPAVTYFFLFFVILCLLGLSFGIGTLSADDDRISVKKPWAAYQIHWSDIQFIELSSYAEDGLLVFSGKDKRLRFAAPALWKWKQKGDFLLFVNQKIEEQQIETKTNWKAVFHFNKNVRVSRNG